MISQTCHISSEASFDEQKKGEGGCSCSNTVISDTELMIPFVRDFPKDCDDRWLRFATRCSQYSVQADSSSSSSFYYSSESEDGVGPLLDNVNELEAVSSKEVERKDMAQDLYTKDPIHLLETSDNETKELPKKVVSGFMLKGCAPHKRVLAVRDYPSRPGRFQAPFSEDLSKGCAPHKRVLAVRDYPSRPGRFQASFSEDLSKGCASHKRVLAVRDYPSRPGRFQAPFSEDLVQSKVPDSRPCYDAEFEDLMVSSPENNGPESIKSEEEETSKSLDDNELIGLEETSEHEAKESSEEADLDSEDSIISMYNISLNSFGLSEDEGGVDMPKVIDSMSDSEESYFTDSCKRKLKESENLSNQCNDKRPETGPSTAENRVPKGPKQIVIALMAAPNCAGSQKKTASGSNTTRGTNKRKRKKR